MAMTMELCEGSASILRGDPYLPEDDMAHKTKKTKKKPILVRMLSGVRDKMLRASEVRTK